jgi:AcrR family transcriptional regulator
MATIDPEDQALDLSARRARTRQALLDAGSRLLAEKPIDAIAIDEIVRAASVAKGSFFNHFADKEAFGRAVARQLRAEIEAAVAGVNRGIEDPARRVARSVCLYVRYALRHAQRAGVLLRVSSRLSQPDAPLNQGVLDDVSKGLLTGRFSLPTAESGVLFILGVAQIALARVTREPSASLAEALGQQLCALLLRGLGLAPDEADQLAARAAHEVIGGPERRSDGIGSAL